MDTVLRVCTTVVVRNFYNRNFITENAEISLLFD